MSYRILNAVPIKNKIKWFLMDKQYNKFSFITDQPFQDYFMLSEKELEVFKQKYPDDKYNVELLKNAVFERWEKSKERVYKVSCPIYKKYKYLEELELEEGILVDEADINYIERIFIDMQLKGFVDIKNNQIVKSQDEDFPPLRICWADYETDDRLEIAKTSKYETFAKPDVMRIISCSMIDNKTGVVSHFCEDSEKILLEKIAEYFNNFDVILFWNGKEFDEKFDLRFKMHKIKYNPKFFIRLDYMRIFEMLNAKEREFLGIDVTAQRYLNIRKIKHKWTFWEAFQNHREELKIYNNRDVEIMYELEKKFGYAQLVLSTAEDVGFLPQRYTYARYASIPYIYKKSLNHFGKRIVWKSKSNIPTTDSYKGAIVLDPIKGIHKNIIAVDLASLYNSIIQTFNISPEQLIIHEDGTHSYDRFEHTGLMPLTLQEFEKSRNAMKKKRSESKNAKEFKFYDILQAGLKVRLLSIYGGIGARGSKRVKAGEKPSGAKSFYNWHCANDVTKYAREIIMIAVKVAESLNYSVVYGDTDSIYVSIGNIDLSISEVKQKMNELTTSINVEYEKMLDTYNIPKERRKIKMEAQGYYSPFVLFDSKKHYFAKEVWNAENDHINENLEIYAKGVKMIQLSVPPFIREFQKQIYTMVLEYKKRSEIERYVSDVKDKYDKGEFDNKLYFETKLTKKISEYQNINGHVKLAKQLIKQGKMQEKSNLVYVIQDVDFGGKPIMSLDTIYPTGRAYVWRNHIQKWLSEVVDMLDVQSSLDDFF